MANAFDHTHIVFTQKMLSCKYTRQIEVEEKGELIYLF